MKVKYLLVISLVAILAVIVYKHYKDKKKEDEAKAYYELARDYYKKSEFDNALIVLDSLELKYPTAWDVKYLAEKLKLNIDKKLYADSIDFVKNIINEYKEDEKAIDSLQILKSALEEKYSQILFEENKYQCSQCVTYMRNWRGIDTSDDLE